MNDYQRVVFQRAANELSEIAIFLVSIDQEARASRLVRLATIIERELREKDEE